MTLIEKIKKIYPEITDQDFKTWIVVRDDLDGRGAYIDVWANPNLTKPTQEQLNAIN